MILLSALAWNVVANKSGPYLNTEKPEAAQPHTDSNISTEKIDTVKGTDTTYTSKESLPILVVAAVRPIRREAGDIPSRTRNDANSIQLQLSNLVSVYESAQQWQSHNNTQPVSLTGTSISSSTPTALPKEPYSPISHVTSAGSGIATNTPLPVNVATPPGPNNIILAAPNSTPTIYVTNVEGRFFFGGSPIFNVATQTPPAFTRNFPLVNFNPPAGYTCNGTYVDANTRPFTDVDEGSPCAAIVAEATISAPPPTPTLLQAGVGSLYGFQDVLSTTLYVSQEADITFNLHSDDGFVWGIGPLNGIPGNPQPIRVGGYYDPPSPPAPTPSPTTTFRNFLVVGRRNAGDWGGGEVTIHFPAAGFYPIEIDNAENGDGGLNITLESPSNTPVLNGPSPTATATPTVLCQISSDWCTSLSLNIGGSHNELRGIAVIAQNNIWAVGGHDILPQGGQSLVEHWDGANWMISSSPNVGTLNGVVAVGNNPNDIYAVGDSGIIHYDGVNWSQIANRAGGLSIGAVKSETAYDVWTVGSTIQRYNGINGTWSIYSVPGGGILNGVAVINTTNVAAVGFTGTAPNRRPLITQWDGNAWNTVASPSFFSDSYLTSVDYYGSQLWTVGAYYYSGSDRFQTLIENGDGPASGRNWQVIDSPNPGEIDNRLNHVWFTTEGDVWAVGSYWRIGASDTETLIMRWNDTNWAQVASPAPGVRSSLMGIATIPGNTAVVTSTWAVGSYVANIYGASQTLVERIQAPTATHTNISYYENTLDLPSLTNYYKQGCAAAARGDAGVVILEFGQPRNLGTPANPAYGTRLVGPAAQLAYISNPSSDIDITNAVEQFAKGFHDAYNSPNPNCPRAFGLLRQITLAVGVNNQFNALPTPTVEVSGHAQAWAAMVKQIKNDIAAYSEVSLAAAIDAEPDFDPSYSFTKQWTETYDSAGVSAYYNFGSTDGYPNLAPGDPTPIVPSPFGCCSAWSVDKLYHVSYGLSRALSLPEIYVPTYAREWNRVKRWSIESHQSLIMSFVGEMSECATSPCNATGTSVFFNPEQAWRVFWLEINGDPDTRQNLINSTDIKCSNGYSGVGCSP
jgi:hypothetical protein